MTSAGSEYGPAVNVAINTFKGGEFLDRLGGCQILKKYCPLRNQILTLQYGLFFFVGKTKNSATHYGYKLPRFPKFPCVFAQLYKDFTPK